MSVFSSQFELVRAIAESPVGHTGVVRHKKTGMSYLARVVQDDGDTASALMRLRREAVSVALCDHPRIPRPHTTRIEAGWGVIVYDNREVESLASQVAEHGRYSDVDALHMTAQLLEALEHMHLRGLVHGGLCPRTVLLDSERGITLADFSTATIADSHQAKADGGDTSWTFPYLAPEQTGFTAFGVDHRTDLYCAALIMYRLLSARLPFCEVGDSLGDLTGNILRRPLPLVRSAPAPVNEILLKALKPSASDRYQTALGFRHDVLAALEALSGGAKPMVEIGRRDAVAAVNNPKLFVGREAELAELRKSFRRTDSGVKSTVLVYGASGVGKTEIVRRFAREIDPDKHMFIAFKCNPVTVSQPYATIRSLFSALAEHLPAADSRYSRMLREVMNAHLRRYSGILCNVMPETACWFTEIEPVEEIEPARETDRTIHALAETCMVIARELRLVVFIDDLQWIDKGSFDALVRTARQNSKILTIFGLRTEHSREDIRIHGSPPSALNIHTFIPVLPFEKVDCRKLLSERFGAVTDLDALIDMLWSSTDHTPLGVTEACRYLVNRGHIRPGGAGWCYDAGDAAIPATFDADAFLLSKLDMLGHAERELVLCAGLAGDVFEPGIVAAAAGIDPDRTGGMTAHLEYEGLFTRGMAGKYAFAHDRIREIIEHTTPDSEKKEKCERLGREFARRVHGDPDAVFPAAECLLRSDNVLEAVKHAVKAGDRAGEKSALEVAIRFYAEALELYERLDTAHAASIDARAIRMKLGTVLTMCGRNQEALDLHTALLDSQSLDKDQAVEIHSRLGLILQNMGRLDESIQHHCMALSMLGMRFPRRRCRALVGLPLRMLRAAVTIGYRRIVPRRTVTKRTRLKAEILYAMELSHFYRDPLMVLVGHFELLTITTGSVFYREKALRHAHSAVLASVLRLRGVAVSQSRKAFAIANQIRRKDILAIVQMYSGVFNYFLARWDQSSRFSSESIATYREIGDRCGQVIPHEHLVMGSVYRGDIARAYAILPELIELSRATGDRRGLGLARCHRCLLDLIQAKDCSRTWHEALEIRESHLSDIPMNQRMLDLVLSRNHLEKQELCAAWKYSKAVIDWIKHSRMYWEYLASAFSIHCEVLIAEIRARARGDSQLSLSDGKLRKELTAHARGARLMGFLFPAHMGAALRCRAWIHGFAGRTGKARRLFRKAIDTYHSLDMKYEEGRTWRDFGLYLDEADLPGEARDHYNAAYRLFARCGAKLETDRLTDKVDPELLVLPVAGVSDRGRTAAATSSGGNMRVDAIYELSASMSEIDDIDVLMRQILAAMIKATGAQYGYVHLDSSDGFAGAETATDHNGTPLDAMQFALPEHLLEQARRLQEIVIDSWGAGTDSGRSRSVMCVPLSRGGTVLGTVYLANDLVANLFSKEAGRAAQVLSAQAGVLIENARLIAEYKNLASDLERRVEEKTRDLEEQNARLEKAQVLLMDSERMKDVLTGTIVHDIKSSIFGIATDVRFLKKKAPDEPRVRGKLDRLESTCTDIFELTGNLLDIGRIEEGKLILQPATIGPADIGDMVARYANAASLEHKAMTTHVDAICPRTAFRADRYLLRRSLENLLSNAVKYAPKGSTITISSGTAPEGAIVGVHSEGARIPPEQHERIFEKYARVERERSQYSKGLGLFFCRMVMDAHGGCIRLAPCESGNLFELVFPNTG